MSRKIHAYMREGSAEDSTEHYATTKRLELLFEYNVRHDMVVVEVVTLAGPERIGTFSKELTEAMFDVTLGGYCGSPHDAP